MLDSLCCPRCAGTLAAADSGLLCGNCGGDYPVLGTIPCLVEDPALWRTAWLRRLYDYSRTVAMRVPGLVEEAEMPELLPRTRQRLLRTAAAFEQQLEVVTALFEPLAAGSDPVIAAAIPNRPEPGPEGAIFQCYENIFRDWAWGRDECELVLSLVAPLIPEGLERIAFYGAGTGRLALDVHQSRGPIRTLALDVNPLPFLVAGRLIAGETVTLPEFPADPISDDAVVISRTMACASPVRDGFSLLFADALKPPIAAGSLDAVVTSWLIDVARADLRQTAAAINRVLRPGGIWVNIGPLRFHSTLSRAYSFEEVLEIVGVSAFELMSHDREELPYFDSPLSGSRRRDMVFRFAARKAGEVPSPEIPAELPPWVTNPLTPIPITPGLIALGRSSMFTTGMLGMIDGRRSVVDVARECGKAWGIHPTMLEDELRNFLANLFTHNSA